MSSTTLAAVVAKTSGAVYTAQQLAEQATDLATRPVLSVLPPLAELLPAGGLQVGSTVTVSGSHTLLLSLLAATTQHGWAAAVGFPDLGLLAAAELGVHVSQFALVPHPGAEVGDVVAALLDGFSLVAVAANTVLSAGPAGRTLARRLTTRARNRGAVLLAFGDWPTPDLQLRCSATHWYGLGDGHGHLTGHEATVEVRGRGSAGRPRQTRLRWPFEPRPGAQTSDDAHHQPPRQDLPLAPGAWSTGPTHLRQLARTIGT
jgi:hypothetical protein